MVRAEELYREALALARRRRPGTTSVTAELLDDLGRVRQEQGDLAGAERLEREALAIRRRTLGEGHGDVAASLNNIAVVLGQRGEYAAAESLHREALRIIRDVRGDRRRGGGPGAEHRGRHLSLSEQVRRPPTRSSALPGHQAPLFGPEHPDYAWTLLSYATSLYDRGDYAGSAARAREVLALRGKTLTDEHVLVAGTLLYLGRSLDHLDVSRRRSARCENALELRRKYLPAGALAHRGGGERAGRALHDGGAVRGGRALSQRAGMKVWWRRGEPIIPRTVEAGGAGRAAGAAAEEARETTVIPSGARIGPGERRCSQHDPSLRSG